MKLKAKEKKFIEEKIRGLVDAYGSENIAKIFYEVLFDNKIKNAKEKKLLYDTGYKHGFKDGQLQSINEGD